jgi:phosphoglucomutase
MMTNFRENPPTELGGSKIGLWKDDQTLECRDAQGNKGKLEMPATSKVLKWFCEVDTNVSVRPSGTEPKIKFYIEVKDPTFKCAGCYERCTNAALEKVEAIKKSLNL